MNASLANKALEAISNGLKDGGCEYVTNFPGYYSHEIFNLLGGKYISLNEKVAYEMAFGASLAGVRSVVTFKSFGLNVAADPFLNSMVSGVNSGLVLVLTEDVEVEGSQCRQDSRSYRDFFGGLWFEPSTLEEAYNIAYDSFLYSEQLDVPIVIRLTNQFFKLKGNYERKIRLRKSLNIAASPKKFLIHPFYSKEQRDNLHKKNMCIESFVEEFYLARNLQVSETKNGCIVFGNCQVELQEYPDHDQLSVITYPVPLKLLNKFLESKQKVSILEQGNNYGFNMIRKIASSLSPIEFTSNTGFIPDHTARYINWTRLEKLFMGLKRIKPSFVVGDLGQYTKENTNTIQACLCLGASVPIGIGLCEVDVAYPFCIAGDASLIHAGVGVINEALSRKVNMGIIIIDNGGSQSTGGQITPSNLDLLEEIQGIKIVSMEYDKLSEDDFSSLFREAQTDGKTLVFRVIN